MLISASYCYKWYWFRLNYPVCQTCAFYNAILFIALQCKKANKLLTSQNHAGFLVGQRHLIHTQFRLLQNRCDCGYSPTLHRLNLRKVGQPRQCCFHNVYILGVRTYQEPMIKKERLGHVISLKDRHGQAMRTESASQYQRWLWKAFFEAADTRYHTLQLLEKSLWKKMVLYWCY